MWGRGLGQEAQESQAPRKPLSSAASSTRLGDSGEQDQTRFPGATGIPLRGSPDCGPTSVATKSASSLPVKAPVMHPSQETDTGIHLSSWKNIYLEALRGNDGTVANSTVLPASVNSSPVHPLDQIKQMWEPVWTHHCFSHALVPTYDPPAARQATSGSDPDCPHLSPAEPLHPSPNASSIDGFLPGLQLRPPGPPQSTH